MDTTVSYVLDVAYNEASDLFDCNVERVITSKTELAKFRKVISFSGREYNQVIARAVKTVRYARKHNLLTME